MEHADLLMESSKRLHQALEPLERVIAGQEYWTYRDREAGD